jgi:hypothetical protein
MKEHSLIIQEHYSFLKEIPMKKILSSIVAAIIAVSFTGLVSAAEPPMKEAAPAAAAPATGEMRKEEKKPVRKAKKSKKVKKAVKNEDTQPTAPATKK